MPVLFSSHQLELVESLCDDLVILADGRLVATGSVDSLRSDQASRYRVVLAGERDAGSLADVPGLRLVEAQGSRGLVELDGIAPEARPGPGRRAAAARWPSSPTSYARCRRSTGRWSHERPRAEPS